MNDLSKAKSQLKLNNLYFKKIIFERNGNAKSEEQPHIGFNQEISELGDEVYEIKLSVHIEKEEEYIIKVELVGEFSISDDLSGKASLLKNNTAAIMFPYLRSQLTLLTAQPNMAPIVIPPININHLLNQNDKPEDVTNE